MQEVDAAGRPVRPGGSLRDGHRPLGAQHAGGTGRASQARAGAGATASSPGRLGALLQVPRQ
eukprot:9453882-Alexandrium_andersonii.AAC.1